MLGASGKDAIRAYAQRTNLPAYTRNTLTALPDLIAACRESLARGYALDDEEAEIDVGCIGVLIRDGTGNVSARLSVSLSSYCCHHWPAADSPVPARTPPWRPMVRAWP